MAYTPRNPNGQATMANSEPVVLASDQTDIKITLDGETVAISSSALPTGAATSALQTTGNTSLSTIAGAVSGTEMQVDVLTMPTVTVQATDLDIRNLVFATDKVDISGSSVSISGSVDTELPTSAALADNTANPTVPSIGTFPHWFDGTTWDRALGNATDGLLVNLGANNDVTVTGTVAATQSGTWNITNISGTVSLPTGASTLTEQQTQTTHLATIAGDTTDIEAAVELIDDTVVTLGTSTYTEATSKGLVIGGVRRDVDTTLVDTTNEFAPLQLDANGRLKVEVFSGETLPVSMTSTTITGTVAVTQSGTWDEVGINDSGNSITVDAPVGTPVNIQIGDGTRTATVRDTGTSDSLNVAIVDGSGNQITSFGGGTEYTEDSAAAANPLGKATILVRQDTPATLVDTDGDNVAQRGTNYGAAYVQLVTSAGAYIDSVGGGTQYTEGDTDATITGTAMMMEGAGNTLVPAQGTVADGLLVNLGANNDVTVTSGSITATQGTAANLNATVVGTGTFAVQLTGATNNINNISGTVSLPTGAATEATLASLLTSAQLIDDTIITLGTDTYTEATSKGQILAAVRRDADTTLVNTTNEYGPLQMDANGRLKVEAFSGETLPVSLTSTTITGTVAVTKSGTWTLDANSGVDIGDVTINNAAGASAVNIQDGGNSITVDNGGIFVTQENGGALTALQLIDNTIFVDNAGFTDNSSSVSVAGYYFDEVAGTALTENDVAAARIDSKRAQVHVIEDGTTRGLRVGVIDETGASAVDALAVGGGTAHDAVDSGNPIKVGAVAIAHGTNPTAVAAADRTVLYANRAGIPFYIGGHPNIIRRTAKITDATGAQTDASIIGTINAGTKVVVTQLTVTVDSATTNTGGVMVKVGFGATTLPADSSTGANGIIMCHDGIAAGSGVSIGDGSGIIGIGADGEELRLTCEDPAGGNICVSFSYYTIES